MNKNITGNPKLIVDPCGDLVPVLRSGHPGPASRHFETKRYELSAGADGDEGAYRFCVGTDEHEKLASIWRLSIDPGPGHTTTPGGIEWRWAR